MMISPRIAFRKLLWIPAIKFILSWDLACWNRFTKRFYSMNYIRNLDVERQKAIPVIWDNLKMERGFRADLIVEDKVLIELKSIKRLEDVHYKQVLTYLKLTGLKLGLLINFNEKLIKNGIKRVVKNL